MEKGGELIPDWIRQDTEHYRLFQTYMQNNHITNHLCSGNIMTTSLFFDAAFTVFYCWMIQCGKGTVNSLNPFISILKAFCESFIDFYSICDANGVDQVNCFGLANINPFPQHCASHKDTISRLADMRRKGWRVRQEGLAC